MDDSATEDYLRLLARHERDLAAYVYSLVAERADGDEILQEAIVVMWKKFETFEPNSNFAAWGKKISLGLVLNFRRSNRRCKTTPTEMAFIEAVAAEIDQLEQESMDHRSEALEACLKKLPATSRQMVLWRYYDDKDITTIAAETRRSEGATYRMLSRVRKLLQNCIDQEMKNNPASL